jgi:hypothetical protein
MKITKSQLKSLIKEEVSRFKKIHILENRKRKVQRELRILSENEEEKSLLKIGDLYNDLFYGGFYVLTDFNDVIVVLTEKYKGNKLRFDYEDFLELINGEDKRFLKVGKNQEIDNESIKKNRQDTLERMYKEDPEAAYHATGTYYPIKGKHY